MIGLSDGLTVPFALTAGLSSLGESKLVILGGIAELIAGAISMGIGGFLASQAERDHYRYQRKVTAARVYRSCDGEMEREVVRWDGWQMSGTCVKSQDWTPGWTVAAMAVAMTCDQKRVRGLGKGGRVRFWLVRNERDK